MRTGSGAWSIVAGVMAAATIAAGQLAPSGRVRVLGDTMARQVVTRVDPVYPAAALEKGVAGDVTLYTAVGKDGAVEQVAVVDGPAPLQRAAIDAVKQWRFSPWVVNGAPVEVDTTVVLRFKPQAAGSSYAAQKPASNVPLAGASSNATARSFSRAANTGSGSQATAVPLKASPQTLSSAAGVAMTKPPPAGSYAGEPGLAAYGAAPQLPPLTGSRSSDMGTRSSNRLSGASIDSTSARSNGTVIANGGRTEWHLIKKAAPEYPQGAVDAGIEGVVLVSGTVKTDGLLRDLHAVSGPVELRQAAVDAAAQYVYEPVMHGDELSEARTQVPVTFTLSGPAKVPAEVMAGRIVNSFTPAYPPEAIKAGIGGAVILHVLIGRQGQVKDVQVVSGREMLRPAAVDAVKQWRYLPYKRAGVDVEVETNVEVQFTLLRQ